MARETIFDVDALGVGRPDYSRNIAMAVEPTTRGHQVKFVLVYSYSGIPVLPFPYYYYVEIPFLNEDGDWQFVAPRSPYHLYRGGISTPRNERVMIDLGEYSGLTLVRSWGPVYDYKDAELKIAKGLTTVEGYSYYLGFTQWSELSTFACHIYGEMLWESETQ